MRCSKARWRQQGMHLTKVTCHKALQNSRLKQDFSRTLFLVESDDLSTSQQQPFFHKFRSHPQQKSGFITTATPPSSPQLLKTTDAAAVCLLCLHLRVLLLLAAAACCCCLLLLLAGGGAAPTTLPYPAHFCAHTRTLMYLTALQ